MINVRCVDVAFGVISNDGAAKELRSNKLAHGRFVDAV